jgi:hypothetical protein
MRIHSEQVPKHERVQRALCTSFGNLSIVDDKYAATSSGRFMD